MTEEEKSLSIRNRTFLIYFLMNVSGNSISHYLSYKYPQLLHATKKACEDELIRIKAIPPFCPDCSRKLTKVKQKSDSPLSHEHFMAIRKGDWFCNDCKGNKRGIKGDKYFWNHELGIED